MEQRNIRTGISPAHWCSGPEATFEEAYFSDAKDRLSICWFDRLLNGGIHLPEGDKPLIVLLEGTPGSGKSTLALELCSRVTEAPFGLVEGNNTKQLSSLYVSVDTDAQQLISKVNMFEWSTKTPIPYNSAAHARITGAEFCIAGCEHIRENQNRSENFFSLLSSFMNSGDTVEKTCKDISNILNQTKTRQVIKKAVADIIVIDSLNVLANGAIKGLWLDEFLRCTTQSKMIICVVDSGDTPNAEWTYMADLILKLGARKNNDYYIRKLEITKARYQNHVLGEQQFKIYSKPDPESDAVKIPDFRRLAHPYLSSGGIFFYPSIHYYLSKYKRSRDASTTKFEPAYPVNLNRLIIKTSSENKDGTGLLPKGRCTALLGYRGSHKSHLAYCHCLNKVLGRDDIQGEMLKKGPAVIVSLRDDEGMTRQTLSRILGQENNLKKIAECDDDLKEFFAEGKNNCLGAINRLVEKGRLDILYFPPGFITPEEFFHRIMMCVFRMKKKDVHQDKESATLMFNSLDQLSARFPLCAQQKIFVPGLIEALSAENVTSLFVAVNEEGQPKEQYGLLPMADLILSFEKVDIENRNYCLHATNQSCTFASNEDVESISCRETCGFELTGSPNSTRKVTTITVKRAAGGQAAGASGILELISGSSKGPFNTPGLNFVKL